MPENAYVSAHSEALHYSATIDTGAAFGFGQSPAVIIVAALVPRRGTGNPSPENSCGESTTSAKTACHELVDAASR